jgi:hypothetical protein
MKNHHIAVRISFYTAVVSFLTAATIFALYFFSGDLKYAFIGYFSMLALGLINVVALVILGVAMLKNPSIRRIGSTTILFQLFNIPVAMACLWAGARLTNIARITLVNETGTKLENLLISGCESSEIKQLEPGASETVWINIKSDCSVKMQYVQGDSTLECSVCGYLCQGMGVVYTYNIGGENTQP